MQIQAVLLIVMVGLTACSPKPEKVEPIVPPAIIQYFSGLDAIYRAGSTEQDIDALFTLFHDSVRYVHVNYEANFDKASWHAAFVTNHRADRYANPVNQCSVVTNAIKGLDYYAIEYAYGVLHADACTTKDDKRLLVLFGFEGDKIRLVQELW